MNRLYLRLLLVLLGTALLSFAAFLLLFFRMTEPTVSRLARTVQEMTLSEAVSALQSGGIERASDVLKRRNLGTNATHYLTDASGRDLITGDDRSSLLVAAEGKDRPVPVDGRPVLVWSSADSRYRLISIASPPFGFVDILPYYLLLLAAIAVLCWFLAVNIVRPLRKIAVVIDAFGKGDLAARTGITRGDEIGSLARSVDGMGQRIAVLLSAERRLLLDVSHELRSPLTRLNLSVELSRTADDANGAADRLQRDVNRLSSLVATLLEVTRLEGEGLHVNRTPVELADVIGEVINDASLEAHSREVDLNLTLTKTTIYGDTELLRRAFENVVRNAVRHAPAGSRVDVVLEAEARGAIIVVRDRGPGVPEAAVERLGTPFFRVDASRETSTGGLGLGLSIARRAVERHGGIWRIENAAPGLRVSMMFPSTSLIN